MLGINGKKWSQHGHSNGMSIPASAMWLDNCGR